MKDYMKKFSNIILNFSASCNMMCKYCDFNDKDYSHANTNEQIRQAILDGSYLEKIKETTAEIRDQISGINLWGLEPSINFDICEDFFKGLLDYFYNVKWLFYSTNCNLNLERHKKIFDFFNNYDRKVTLKLQISIDGPAWITDENRQIGAMSRIMPTLESMVNYAKTLDKNLFIDANITPTLDSKHMQILVDDDEKFHEYYGFFDILSKKINIDGKFEISAGVPTLIIPHYHTTEDGILLKKFIHKLVENTDKYDFPLFLQASAECDMIFADAFTFLGCSAGIDSLPINYTGDFYGCQALFKIDYDGSKERAQLGWTTRLNKDYDDWCWRTSLIPKSKNFYFNQWDGQIILLATAGQIDSIYKTDKNARNLLKMLCSTFFCAYGQLSTTKSPWIPTMSFIRLLGNGAVPELLKLYKKQALKEAQIREGH